MTTSELTAVIFSKDRPLQLDGLLRSIQDHWTVRLKMVCIVFRASSKEYNQVYNLVWNEHRWGRIANSRTKVCWCREEDSGGFRKCYEDIINILSPEENVVFWTDDDLVYQPVLEGPETYAEFDPEKHLFLSTRLDRGFKLAHAVHVPESQRIPPLFLRGQDHPLEWEWKKAPCTPWNYSFSVEGTIYNVGLLQRMHRMIHFRAPNTYECEGANWCNHQPGVPALALSTPRAATFGNNINITQVEWTTPHGRTWTMDRLNKEYLAGRRLNLSWFYDHAADITDCHHIIEAEEILTSTP